MQKLSPLMKGLLETRARADAEHQNALKAANLRINHLNRITLAYQREQARIQQYISQAQEKAEAALAARLACDQLILKLQQGIDLSRIEPINAWQGRYGQRGALGQAVQAVVEAAYPLEVTTTQIAASIQHQFKLSFPTPKERKSWVRTSIAGRLKYLRRLGHIERLHDPAVTDGKSGRWRAVPSNPMDSDLIALASQANIPLTFFSGDFSTPESTEEDDLPR